MPIGGYDPDLMGPLEARLIAVERRTVRLDDDVRQLRRGLVETQQRIRDSWADWRLRPAVAAAPAPANDFPLCCPSGTLATTILIHDSQLGAATTLTYDPANLWWQGCAVFSIAAGNTCPAFTGALKYRLVGSQTFCNWSLELRFNSASTGARCPVASACSGVSDAQAPKVITRSTAVSCTGVSTWVDTNPARFYNIATGTITYTLNLFDGS